MNCQLVRNRVMAVEEPSRLPGELAAHIESCEACSAWHSLFTLMDNSLSHLPTLESPGVGKTALLEKLRTQSSSKPEERQPKRTTPARSTNHQHAKPQPLNLEEDLPRRKFSFGKLASKFWPAGLVAATLLIGTLAWFSLRGDKPKPADGMPSDPMLDSVVQLNVELAKSQTPAERVAILGRLSDELSREMCEIARADATGESMQALGEMYRKVVLQGLVAQARLVERSERELVLGSVEKTLVRAGREAEKLALESPVHSANRLREAAETAREGTVLIRGLIREAS